MSSCNQSEEMLVHKQREKIRPFFEELLLEHGGAYTLFGSKPITVEPLLDCSDEAFQELQVYLAEHPDLDSILVDRKLEEGWEEWKKLGQPSPNYILTEVVFDGHKELVFANVKNAITVIRDNYDYFKSVLGQDFSPEELVQQLRIGKHDFWRKLLSDYVAMGILFGYGRKNAFLFEKRVHEKKFDLGRASECSDPRMDAECYLEGKPFRIPIFVMLDEDESKHLVSRYKEERGQIKRRYLGRDFLQVTWQKLVK